MPPIARSVLINRAQAYRPGEDLSRRRTETLLDIISRGKLAAIAIKYDPNANSKMTPAKLERIIMRGQLRDEAEIVRDIMPRTDESLARMSIEALRKYIAEARAKKESPEFLEMKRKKEERAALFDRYRELSGVEASRKTSNKRLMELIRELTPLVVEPSAPAVGNIEYKVAREDRFKGFRSIQVDLFNVDTIPKLWEAYNRVVADRGIEREAPHMMINFVSADGQHVRHVTIKHDYLLTLDDFAERIRSIVNDGRSISGSDAIDTEDYELSLRDMKLSYHTLIGEGGTSFIFAKTKPDGWTDAHEKEYKDAKCLYRAIHMQLSPSDKANLKKIMGWSGVRENETEIRNFEPLMNKLGMTLRIWQDFPHDYFRASIKWVKIDGKLYRHVPCTRLQGGECQTKHDYADNKEYKAVDIVYGSRHFEPYYGLAAHEVYEDNPKNLYYRVDGNASLKKVGRDVVVDNANLRLPSFEQQVVVYDLETTFSNIDNAQLKPYSNAWAIRDEDKYVTSMIFGEDCVGDFFDTLMNEQRDKMYCLAGYNSSRFDNIFTIPELLRKDLLNDVFYQGNSVLNIKWGSRHVTFDMCRYTMAPLKKACADFGTKFRKMGDFDHIEIQRHFNEHGNVHSFFHEPNCTNTTCHIKALEIREPSDLARFGAAGKFGCMCPKFMKLVEYNMLDVLSSYEIYEKLEEFLYEAKVISAAKNERAFDRKTIGSAIYRMFDKQNRIDSKEDEGVRLPELEYDDYKAVRGGLFAGRTQCYGGPQCDLSGNNEYRMLDVKSLYPYVMLNRDYPCGEIKKMTFGECAERGLIGFFECTFSQEKLRIKVIPRRAKGEPLDWNYSGSITACLSTVDIKCLYRNGATFESIANEGIVFTEVRPGSKIFECMLYFKKVKEDEDAKPKSERNNVKRNMAKLFLNSLSGKVNEMLHVDKTVLVRTQRDMDNAIKRSARNEDLVLNEILSSTAGIVSYTQNPEDIFKAENRPVYLGVLIYAYAREHMYETILKDYDVIYQDTDSALITKATYDKFALEKPELLGENFGQLALEEGSEKMAKFMTIAPKNYFITDKEGGLIKKGFKGVNLGSDKFVPNPRELPHAISEGKHNDFAIKSDAAFDLYHGTMLKTVAKDHARFMETIQKNGKAYVLCSSLRKCMRNVGSTDKKAGMIYQEFTLKEIRANPIHQL